MSRFVWMSMLLGLFAALGCEQKPADWTTEKVTSADVRRDADKAVKTAVDYSRQTKEEFQEKLETKLADSTPMKAASEDARQDADKVVKKTSEYYERTKDEFQKKLEAKLKELDTKIYNLRQKGRDLKESAKDSWNQKMAELDVKRDTAREKLAKVVHSSTDAWTDFKQAAESAYDDLERTINDVSKEYD